MRLSKIGKERLMSETHPQGSVPTTPSPSASQAPRKSLLARAWPTLVVLGVALVAGALLGLWSFSGDKGGQGEGADASDPIWKADPESPSYGIELRPEGSPRILDPSGTPLVDLGLVWWGDYGESAGEGGCAGSGTCLMREQRPLGSWSHDTEDDIHTLSSTFEGAHAKVEAQWRFKPGDPRVRLEVAVTHTSEAYPDREALQIELFDRPAVLGRDLRFAVVEASRGAFSDRWTPHRVIAGAGERALQLMAWGFDGMEVAGKATGGVITLELDDARNHPFRPMADCNEEAGQETRVAHDRLRREKGHTKRWRVDLWLGHTWGPMVSRLPEGRLAALALVDDSADTDAQRLSAVMWGHSNPADPRYGNGGVLGHGLSMTKGLPLSGDEALVKAAESAAGLGVRFAAQSLGGAEESAGDLSNLSPATWLDRFQSCGDFHGAGWRGESKTGPTASGSGFTYAWSGLRATTERGSLNILQPATKATRTPLMWSHNRSGQTLHLFKAVSLSASRTQLLGHQLTQAALDRLVAERGIAIGRSEMDNRSASADSQKLDGLLVPEPDGHYVIAGDLETRLFEMSELSERKDLWVAPLEVLSDRLRAVSKVVVQPQSNGRIRVDNPGDETIEALTLGLPGHGYSLSVEGATISGQRDIKLARGQRETWVWFDLPPKSQAILTVHDARGYRLQPLIPVTWAFKRSPLAASSF